MAGLLEGKVVIVTGGSRGIGKAIALRLGGEGARVAIGARTVHELESTQAELAADGVETLIQATDVTRLDDVDALVREVVRRWGTVDVLVNDAGVYGAIGPLDECDPVEWKRAFEVNVFGTMHACRAVIPGMRRQGSGKIVNLAGGGVGGRDAAPRMSAYAASKAAIVQFTESLATELSDDGIQVNAISPGAVVTKMTSEVLKAGPGRAGPVLHERTRKQSESGGESPDLAAGLVVWLASDASGTLTGKLLSAKWDKPEAIDIPAANRSSLYMLRRIDTTHFREVPRG
jgi:NAD(P)-dependent dehydrogenase (short-subunit alcohol dehydrogenase family)